MRPRKNCVCFEAIFRTLLLFWNNHRNYLSLNRPRRVRAFCTKISSYGCASSLLPRPSTWACSVECHSKDASIVWEIKYCIFLHLRDFKDSLSCHLSMPASLHLVMKNRDDGSRESSGMIVETEVKRNFFRNFRRLSRSGAAPWANR